MKIIDYLEANGCHARIVSIKHLEELREEIESQHRSGLLDDQFFKEWMPKYLHPRPPKGFHDAKSIIIVSVPQPAYRLTFHWKGEAVRGIVPPTYGGYYEVFYKVRELLQDSVGPGKYWFRKAVLPLKLLACRSGLARYGKNNITYVPGHGSFHRLAAFYTNFESSVDNWQEMEPLPECGTCRACTKACPTGAISEDRFLLHAEKCVTYLNEKDSKHPFPEWVRKESHNAIVGCMKCQRACRYNRDVIEWFEDRAEFSEEETKYLLAGKFSGNRKQKLEGKLKKAGLELDIFPRNLRALLAAKSISSRSCLCA